MLSLKFFLKEIEHKVNERNFLGEDALVNRK